MTRHAWIVTLTLVTGFSAVGYGLLTAEDVAIPKQRVSPKVLKETLEHPVITATAPRSSGRNIQDLRTLANDLEQAGHKPEASRLKGIIKELVRHFEIDLSEKKAQVARLNSEIDELKGALAQ